MSFLFGNKSTSNTAPVTLRQKISLIGLSFGLILLLEIILRCFGIGGHPPLFIPLVKNPDGSWVYVTNRPSQSIFFMSRTKTGQRLDGGLLVQRITMPKPKNVLRIIYVGESTVQGFPYPKTLCSAAFLSNLLQQSLPGKNIEIINLGITAAASYPVWKITQQALNYEPDALVIYTGHNEYFGAFGVASLQSVGNEEWKMNSVYWLRGLGLYQGIVKLMDLVSSFSKPKQQLNLIQVMAKTDNIPLDSPLRTIAQRNLQHHLQLMIQTAKQKNIPVVLCTLISNERDMAPLRSPGSKLPFNIQSSVLIHKKYDVIAQLKQAIDKEPTNALAHYYYAKSLENSKDTSRILQQYQTARDLDEMPWRASESTNQIIRSLASENKIWLCDVENKFHQTEPLGIGWRLTMDHLHPSLEGQVLLAQSVFDTLKSNHWADLDKSTTQLISDWKTLADTQGYNDLKEYEVVSNMVSLWSRPPMNSNNENASLRFKAWENNIISSFDSYELKAIDNWYNDLTTFGYFPDLAMFVGDLYFERGQLAPAREYFKGAWLEAKDLTMYKLHLAMNISFCTKMLDKDLSEKDKQFARNNLNDSILVRKLGVSKTEWGDFYRIRGGLHQVLDEHQEAIQDFKKSIKYFKGRYRQQIAINMAQSYIALHQIEDARHVLQEEEFAGDWDGPTRLLQSIQTKLP